MSLLRTLIGAPVRSTHPTIGFQQYLNLLFQGSTYPLMGLQQTQRGEREEVDRSFGGYVLGAFQSNAIVFACEAIRIAAFSEARFQWRRLRRGQQDEMFGTEALAILERPWTGGVTGDLLARALLYADFAGTAFFVRTLAQPDRIRLPRPDWITTILGSQREADDPAAALDADFLGCLYHPGGPMAGKEPETLKVVEVAPFAPIPDPTARVRGVPWIAPVLQEVLGDKAATSHKLRFFENAATPNMVVSLDKDIAKQTFDEWVKTFKEREPVNTDAYRTLYLGGGATATVVGSDLQQLDFKVTQGAGETRIAAAAGVGAVMAQISEGLAGSSLNAGNFAAARRRFADLTIRPLWRNVSGSLEDIVPPPAGAQLWWDEKGIGFLREDHKDRAEIAAREAQVIRTLVDAGWEAESIKAAVLAEDWSLLKHTGLFSVQLQPPQPGGAPADEAGRALAALVAPHLPPPNGEHA